jgi:hypothetical protein
VALMLGGGLPIETSQKIVLGHDFDVLTLVL